MTHSYAWHELVTCVTGFARVRCTPILQMCDRICSCVLHESFVCVAWLVHMCDMTHSCGSQISSVCVAWLVQMCDSTHVYVWHDSFIWDMAHTYVWHDLFIWDMTHSYVTWLVHMRHDSFICSACRVAKIHRMSHLYRYLSAKEPYNQWVFPIRGLQLKASYASLQPCSSLAWLSRALNSKSSLSL